MLQLGGNLIEGGRVLEIGCGSGHSLKYLSTQDPSELWGLDLSDEQIKTSKSLLEHLDIPVRLFNSPMEENPGIPYDHFDIVYSIYAIGWTLDLKKTFTHIHKYLKKDGIFIFSWDHPLMHCVDEVDEKLEFTGNYHEDDLFSWTKNDQRLSLINRKFSTYINTLFEVGFLVEALIEAPSESIESDAFTSNYYSKKKQSHFPLSFVIKARKCK